MLLGTQRINELGHLEVGGVDTVDLAREFETPLYVIDETGLRARCREYAEAFEEAAPGTVVAFASKSFLCRAMAALIEEEGLHLDTASLGELRVALAAGVTPARITFHGNYKKRDEIRAAIEAGVGTFVIDSLEEIEEVDAVARELGRSQRALVRISPGIDAHTLDAISTGRNDTKFGFTAEGGAALEAIRRCLELSGIDLVGLHAHIGSQILTLEPFELLGTKMLDYVKIVLDATGWAPELLGFGGGLGIRYGEDDEPPSIRDLARTLVSSVRSAAKRNGVPVPRIGVEPGRSMVGELGLTLYTVGPVKEVPSGESEKRTYVSVDGGLSDNPRPLLYGATYPVCLANRAKDHGGQIVRVAGRHCETDTLFDVRLPAPRPGDILAVLSTGAYNHTMASNYNFFCRPPVVFVKEGNARLVVRRETAEDLLVRDVD